MHFYTGYKLLSVLQHLHTEPASDLSFSYKLFERIYSSKDIGYYIVIAVLLIVPVLIILNILILWNFKKRGQSALINF